MQNQIYHPDTHPMDKTEASARRTTRAGPPLEYMESFKNTSGKYQCIHCDRSYLHFKHLRRHFMKHTGTRPHVCSICQDTFCRSDILKRHYARCLQKFKATGKCATISRVPKRIVQTATPLYGSGVPSSVGNDPAAAVASIPGAPAYQYPYYTGNSGNTAAVQPFFPPHLAVIQSQNQANMAAAAAAAAAASATYTTYPPQFPSSHLALPQLKPQANFIQRPRIAEPTTVPTVPTAPPTAFATPEPTAAFGAGSATAPCYPVFNNAQNTTPPLKPIYNNGSMNPYQNPSPQSTNTSPGSSPYDSTYSSLSSSSSLSSHAGQGLAIYQQDGKALPPLQEYHSFSDTQRSPISPQTDPLLHQHSHSQHNYAHPPQAIPVLPPPSSLTPPTTATSPAPASVNSTGSKYGLASYSLYNPQGTGVGPVNGCQRGGDLATPASSSPDSRSPTLPPTGTNSRSSSASNVSLGAPVEPANYAAVSIPATGIPAHKHHHSASISLPPAFSTVPPPSHPGAAATASFGNPIPPSLYAHPLVPSPASTASSPETYNPPATNFSYQQQPQLPPQQQHTPHYVQYHPSQTHYQLPQAYRYPPPTGFPLPGPSEISARGATPSAPYATYSQA